MLRGLVGFVVAVTLATWVCFGVVVRGAFLCLLALGCLLCFNLWLIFGFGVVGGFNLS